MPEQTDLTTQLARLAPELDEATAREMFERRRRPRRVPRWLMPAAAVVLAVVGVIGLAMVTTEDAEAPAVPVDTAAPDATLRPAPGETVMADENFFDVIIVAETPVGFGNAELAMSESELTSVWTDWKPRIDQPAVEFASKVALVMTRPDNACADVVTRFEVTEQNGTAVWTPLFEEPTVGCDDPLLSWLYVVAIDRAALGDEARIRVPAAEVFDVPEQIIEYTAPMGGGADSTDDAPVTLTVTDVVVALPSVDEPTLHNTLIGMFYVVQHEGGDVSVVPATVDRRPTEDEGVTMLRNLVVASESGRSFFSDGDVWDAWGRAATAGRSSDLVGYAGRVVGDEVEVLYSDSTRIEGDPEVPGGEDYRFPPELWEPITPGQFLTLSSSGPLWRLFDANLVVEDGVGRICQIDTTVPADQFGGCDEAGIVIDTLVTSTNPEITTWYESPILAFQDPVRGFTNVIPLAGRSARGR